ncbi:hypothetical protein EF847_05640 [Actinobacteria bacterium YIM 96077]|uniref:Uncharacterized protein n=2 Tax=Phytoactinopolyspora halophila TaxID=1981511 RepID=A0A329QQ13_9ACTN|nr:hypothetical protein EF847_05640 [Actinobacteria bacterium YIM 96077]RAW13819.1 hypothetical protein DPM12_12515 [Phytoactinopolyspora halophila]
MTVLVPAQPGAAADLATFAQRVAKFEAEAVMRIVGTGTVVGCFAGTPFDALAMRAVRLAEPVEIDEVVEASTLAARAVGAAGELDLPPALPALRWTTSLPPRSGWSELARLPLSEVRAKVDAGVAEFRRRAPEETEGQDARAARATLEGLATQIWNEELAAGVPLRLAHAASSYSFLGGEFVDGDGQVVVRSVGSWQRLDAPYGTVLARSSMSLLAL